MATIQATIIRPNQAIRLQARKECQDREGNKRVTGTSTETYPKSFSSDRCCNFFFILRVLFFFVGEEWLVKRVGAYLPGVFEEVVDTVDAFVLTEKVSGMFATPSGR